MSKKKKDGMRHWLDRAEPSFWKPRGCWRVRAMREGKSYQWVLKAGRGDSGSTGKLLAQAEWDRERQTLIKASQPDVDEYGLIVFKSPEEEAEHYRGYQDRADYEASALSREMSFEEWQDLQEWRAWKETKRLSQLQASLDGAARPPAVPTATNGLRPFKELIGIFRAHLKYRLDQTKPNLKSKRDISQSRYEQYGYALDHMESKVGHMPVEAVGEFHIGEKQLTETLAEYRQRCEHDMLAKVGGGHWFNERMKTARSLVTFLCNNRLLSSVPPNIAALTEKYRTEANPKPIPVPTLRAFWDGADDRFRGFMLLALNCGFRQTEIQSLHRHQLKVVAGHLCVVKLRGKTGQPINLPLWASTLRFIDKFAASTGRLFSFETPKEAMASLYHELKVIRTTVAKSRPGADRYSFEHFRDTGASFIDSVNPMLTPLYLGQGDTRQAKQYVAAIEDEHGAAIVPMQLDKVVAKLEEYLSLPPYEP